MEEEFSRGQLAKRADINSETIRYYESVGLMPDPPRTASGHRRYTRDHLSRLRFIKRARELGFEVAETRELVTMAEGTTDCARAEGMAREKATVIRDKIRDLQTMLTTLEDMAHRCAFEETPRCPLIEALADASQEI